eukprot:gene13747-13866_t
MQDCCFSSSAPLLATALVNGQVLLHRYQQGTAEPTNAAAAASQQQEHSPEDQQDECSTSYYSTTEVLSRRSKKGASCRAIVFVSADDAHLACGFETGTLLQLDAATGRVIARLPRAHAAGISRLLAVSQQPSLFAAGDDGGGLNVWDVRSGQSVYSYRKHTDFITGLVEQDRQQVLLAVSGDGTLSAHDLRSRKALAHSESDADDELLSVAVVKQGKKIVCGSQSGVLAIWSWGYWNDCSDRFPGHPESVDAIVKFDEDTIITGSSDGTLRVINILPNKLLGVVGGHADDMPVERLALTKDKRLLVSMSHDSTVKLWDMSILQEDPDADDDPEQPGAKEEEGGEPIGAAVAAAAGSKRTDMPAGASSKPADDDADEDDITGQQGETAAGVSDSSDSDSDSGDARKSQRKKRKRHEKTAMKGRSKPSKSSNFFADML